MAETFLQRQQRIRSRAPQTGPVGGTPEYQTPGPLATAPQRVPPPPAPAAPPPAAPATAAPAAPTAPAAGPTAATGANRPYQPVATAATAPAAAPAAPATASASAPATAPAAPAATYNPAQFSQWATSRYGRAPSAAEMGQIGAAIGAPQGPNGTYTQAQYDAAQQKADALARAQGWNGPALAASGPAAPGIGPNSLGPAFPGTEAGAPGHQGRVTVDPGQGYQAQQLTPFQAPNTGNVGALNTSLMESILANPESLPPSVIAQMKAAGKTSAARQAEQLRQQASTNLAGRGFSGTGGMQAGADAAVDQNFLESLLDSNRNVEIGAATQNFQDRLAASGAGTQFQNAASQRAIGESGAEVQRFGANEGFRQAESADDLNRDQFRYGQQAADRTANLQEWLARNGVNLDTNKLNEQVRQFNQTFGFDVTRFLDDMRRDNRDFGEGQRQANNNLGFGYNQLQQQTQNSLLSFLQQQVR